jgi:hypothetical protein
MIKHANPRWTRWPFKGWREDAAATVLGVLAYAAILLLILWMRS